MQHSERPQIENGAKIMLVKTFLVSPHFQQKHKKLHFISGFPFFRVIVLLKLIWAGPAIGAWHLLVKIASSPFFARVEKMKPEFICTTRPENCGA